MKWSSLVFILFILLSQNLSAVCIEKNIEDTDTLTIKTGLKIPTHDNEIIRANLIVPKENLSKKLPTIIFANSWLLDEHEYLFQAKLLAESGFQVFSYSARGWGCSTGFVSVSGPNDLKDISTIIDWLVLNTNIDIDNIGMSGISYGGGLTLLALGKEPRIKTGVAMSAWADLEDSMLGADTVRFFWGGALVSSGFIIGELDPDLYPLFFDIAKYKNLESAHVWAKERSAKSLIKDIGQKPVFIANNFGDNLFPPNQIIKFFNSLKGQKILDLNQGTHTTGEATGLFKRYNYSFERLGHWFKYFLQGKNTGKIELNKITIETDLKHDREIYPANFFKENKLHKIYYFESRSEEKMGSLLDRPSRRTFGRDSFNSSKDSFSTTGIPIISALFDGNFSIPVFTHLFLNIKSRSLTYITKELSTELKIRGIPKLKLRLRSESNKPFQVVGYLYRIDKYGIGNLITHGVFTHLSTEKPFGAFNIDLNATAFDLSIGDKLAIVIDGEDILYGKLPGRSDKVYLDHSILSPNKLTLPLK